ncbi:MAG: sulfurtransferase FdhD [Crocinitomicaceae bacterium]|nr:sulfurtransferase FdhD [Crocinitomicaceae bacterium]|tara:strand:- start:6169 stop:7017 length:849 start_codon:yes stop_codon:yes gene_type:complete
MKKPNVKPVNIKKVNSNDIKEFPDVLAVEEPLEIRICFTKNGEPQEKNISVTMRTPGNDLELAMGFLFTEGIIFSEADVDKVWHCETVEKEEEYGNVVKVNLRTGLELDISKLERHFYTSSSCGVCGKSSIESVSQNCSVLPDSSFKIKRNIISKLPLLLEDDQTIFKHTGGIHASALFGANGELKLMREDVGRHNALDKIAGAALFSHRLPLSQNILLVSGRASFELVQKTLMLGIPVLCAVGAPSSLAYDLAKENNMTLVGFIKKEGFNIYCGEERISPL